MHHSEGHVLVLLLVALLACLVHGATYQGTPIQASPNGIPTLTYNCAKMPSICQNVNSVNRLTNIRGFGRYGPLDIGSTPNGRNYLELQYDTSNARKKARRRFSCPSSWKKTHLCPEPNQPPVVPRYGTLQNAGANGAAYQAQPFNRQGKLPGSPGYNRIATANGQVSGMIWTCDEWPAASFIQGGNAGNLNTFCAPQNSKCSGTSGLDAEQDFQGRAHSVLRQRVWTTANPTGVYTFHFQTAWNPTAGANIPAAFVTYYAAAGGAAQSNSYSRRSTAPVYECVDEIHSNYTQSKIIRRLSVEESDDFWRRSLPANSSMWIDETVVRHEDDPFRPLLPREVANKTRSPAKQLYEDLSVAPPLAIVDISRVFVLAQARKPILPYIGQLLGGVSSLLPDFFYPSPSTSRVTPGIRTSIVRGSTTQSAPANISVPTQTRTTTSTTGLTETSPMPSPLVARALTSSNRVSPFVVELGKRQQSSPGACSVDSPCPDGSCCNNKGLCGFGPENCGNGNCTSNCDATALCGRDSAGGSVSCPLNVCCSYYGYCGTDPDFCSSPNPQQPCQNGFGSCQTIAAPSCGGSSATQRTIGYYQVANVRERQCNRITPSQIKTTGYTHLNLAFAGIDPSSFAVIPGHPDDVQIYPEFTKLKSSSLQTWIALGGWDFNDPGATRTTWSDLASTSANRAAFISSLKNFMSKYGFQGVDIDWEYPGAPDRAGKKIDTQNLVALVKEMRASFGTTYGISATIPSSYWYLRWFDPKAMQPYVDFFGLMSYDLHGPWDAGVKQIGKTVLGHTNIPEIYNWTLPLWYAPVDPAKIVFGLAFYGRGYTLADPNCNSPGCSWIGTSRPAPCTNFGGVMSLQEIQTLITNNGLTPTLDSKAMMKYLKFGDQWIGYDDNETLAMKKSWASSHCFGGTMAWSVDLNSGAGSGNTPDGLGSTDPGSPGSGSGQGGSDGEGDNSDIVYIDPSIWKVPNPTIQCRPPCTFILPPLVLPSPTTFTFPPYVTSLDVAWSSTGGWTSTVQRTTLTIPPVTTTAIEVWSYVVNDQSTKTQTSVSSSFYVTSSILPKPFVITDDPNPEKKSGVSHSKVTRTITPPPSPYSFVPPTTSPTTSQSSTTLAAGIFPIVTYKPGPPGPICKTGCGRPCIIFCNTPCLINCIDGGNDYPDPVNPNPPPRPTPVITPNPVPTQPPASFPPDPKGDNPDDPEQEEDDEACAFEFDLPAPQYDGPTGAGSSVSSISPPPTPPTPSPTPDPAPPMPNPSTEKVDCFGGTGFMTGRGLAIRGIDLFCAQFAGQVLDASNGKTAQTLKDEYLAGDCIESSCTGCSYLSLTAINGCKFTVSESECKRIFRRAVDECDTSSTKYKQGGTITSNCAKYSFDPNFLWLDGVCYDHF